jgi:acyl CoA:acetate/3-ketoacid CoA transferase beta subunit
MMTHFNKDGGAKLMPVCQLPLTGKGVVTCVVTDMGVFRPENGKFTIVKLAAGVNKNQLGLEAKIIT